MMKRMSLFMLLACTGLMHASQKEDGLKLNAVKLGSDQAGFIATADRYPRVHFCGNSIQDTAYLAKYLLNCVDRESAKKAANKSSEKGFGSGFKKGFLNKKK